MKTVFLWSYIRPEMTAKTISRIISWNGLKKLIVVIDGLRESAEIEESDWRRQTIEIVERYALIDNRIELWLYSDNIGNTNHILRVQERGLDVDEKGIWLEEDIQLDLEEYSRIQDKFWVSDTPFLLTGYSQANHFSVNSVKNTLFAPLWGQTINKQLIENINQIWSTKKFDARIVEGIIRAVFKDDFSRNRNFAQRVTDYWVTYSEWGIKSSRRWDALANYALWVSGNFALSTTQRIAEDLSYLDFRGMNQRNEPEGPTLHELNFSLVDQYKFCIDCERLGSRQESSNMKRAKNSILFRTKKLGKKFGILHQNQWYTD